MRQMKKIKLVILLAGAILLVGCGQVQPETAEDSLILVGDAERQTAETTPKREKMSEMEADTGEQEGIVQTERNAAETGANIGRQAAKEGADTEKQAAKEGTDTGRQAAKEGADTEKQAAKEAADTGSQVLQEGADDGGLKDEELAISEDVTEAVGEGGVEDEHQHTMEIRWFGEAPNCTQGGYQIMVCTDCGWVDEAGCRSVPPSEHVLTAQEIQHGNCREDTIIVYSCSLCGEQTGYERHTEPGEHKWVTREMQVWDEESFSFITTEIICCERCNARPE